MSHGERRVRVVILTSLIVVFVSWMVVTAFAQRRDDVSPATQLLITQVSNANAVAISDLRGDLSVVRQTASDARDEVREMRRAVWAMAGTILISLLMQVAQIRKGRAA
jgi:hypothetical protein